MADTTFIHEETVAEAEWLNDINDHVYTEYVAHVADYDAHVITYNTHITDYDAHVVTYDAHIANTSNPHSVTKVQVGLTNVTDDAQLKIASNLSDVNNVTTSQQNLGVEVGVDVQAFDATILVDADIGVNIQAYSADLTRIDTAIDATNVDAKCLTFDANEDAQFVGTAQFAAGEGVVFNGDAIAAANTLDDYEQGTFTATLTATSGSVTLNSSADTLAYTKVGDICYVQGRLTVSSVSSPSGQLTLNGIPFTTATLDENSDITASPIAFIDLASAVNTGAYVDWFSNATTMRIVEQTTTASSNTMANKMQTNTLLYFNFFYKVA